MKRTLQPAPADDAAQADPVTPDGTHPSERKPLGTLLVEAGLIDEDQLDLALREGSRTGERVGEVVTRRGWATEDQVARVLAEQWGLAYVDRASIWFDADALTRLSREDAQRLEALPTRVEGERVVVAVAEPTEQRLAALEKVIGDTVVVVVPKSALEAGLHSELLSSRSATTGESVPPQDDVLVAEPPAPELPPRAEPAPAPSPEPGPVPGLQGFAALAAQAQRLADLMAAQAASPTKQPAEPRFEASEELAASRRRIEALESELAAQRVAAEELRRHLQAALQVLHRSF